MQTFKVGDHVSVLHETLSGRVIEIKKNGIKIEDSDGFIRSYSPSQLVIKQEKKAYRITDDVYSKDYIEPSLTIIKSETKKKSSAPDRFEIDLHIEELREMTTHFSNFEIVQIQMTACRAFVQESISINRKRIVLIHGKGEGVLKSEIHQYLDRLSNSSHVQLDYNDASYREYGMGGATEVTFYG